MKNILLRLGYDGSNYCGWQIQPNKRSIEGEIKNAIKKLTGENVIIYGSGRTDSGVHAINQYANFYTNSKIPVKNFPIALNGFLEKDIRIKEANVVDKNFHCRYNAHSKEYEYLILNSKISDPLLFNRVWHVPQKLNVELMKKGSELLVGEHDFRAFMSCDTKRENTVREIYDIKFYIENEIIKISFNGNGFLHNMIRIIVGTLVFLGLEKINLEELNEILESKKRSEAKKTAPPQGLYLKNVIYK